MIVTYAAVEPLTTEKGVEGLRMVGGYLVGFRSLGFRFTGSASSLRTEHKEMSGEILVAVLVDMVWLIEPEPDVRAVTELVRPKTLDLELVTPRSDKPNWLTMVLVSMLMPGLTGAEPGASKLKESREMETACTLLLADLLAEIREKSGLT